MTKQELDKLTMHELDWRIAHCQELLRTPLIKPERTQIQRTMMQYQKELLHRYKTVNNGR